MAVDGIDVYAGNGAIDWSQVPGSLGIAKATEGTYNQDSRYITNATGARASSKIAGAYHFIRAQQNWVAQAEYFIGYAGRVLPLPMILALDLEPYPGEQWPLGPDETVANAHVFLARVQELTGITPWLYTYPSFAKFLSEVAVFDELAAYPLWWADPSGINTPPWPAALIQYGQEDVPGAGLVDVNKLGPAYPQPQQFGDDVYLLWNPGKTQCAVMGDVLADGYNAAQLIGAPPSNVLQVIAASQEEYVAVTGKRAARVPAGGGAGGPLDVKLTGTATP